MVSGSASPDRRHSLQSSYDPQAAQPRQSSKDRRNPLQSNYEPQPVQPRKSSKIIDLPVQRRLSVQSAQSAHSSFSSGDEFFSSEGDRLYAHVSDTSGPLRRASFQDPKTVRSSVIGQLQLEYAAVQQEELRRKASQAKLVTCSRTSVESKQFMGVTFLLTLYALSADDIRLMSTNKPADIWFDIITIVCLVIFTMEIVLSCIGQDDYFLGFFFVLDVVSTSTLALDLTWISEELLAGDEEDVDNLKGSKTAKLGARAARIVRVLRLIRILKLYKAMYQARAQKALAERRKRIAGKQEDGWGNEDIDDIESQTYSRESQVGKKLSELTTRRVILLVLSMMLVLPFLALDKSEQLPSTANYGAELVLEAFQRMEVNVSHRSMYERALLQYIYYHNWFTNRRGCQSEKLCPADYYSSVFWIGIMGRRDDTVIAKSAHGNVRPSVIARYDLDINARDSQYSYGVIPEVALNVLGSHWQTECRTKNGMLRRGVGLLQQPIEGLIEYVVKCPEDLRATERMKFYPRLASPSESKEWHFTFYMDMRPFAQDAARFNLITTAFICVVLLLASVCITSDANVMVLKPVEDMILKVDMIRINPLMATKLADDAFRHEEMKKARDSQVEKSRLRQLYSLVLCKSREVAQPMETLILEKTIIKLGTLLALGFGEAGANIIGHNMSGDSGVVNAMIPGETVECVVGSARIRDFNTVTEVLHVKVMAFVNQVAEIVHGAVDEFHGTANRNNGAAFMIIWPTFGLAASAVEKMADMSVMALIRIFGAVNQSCVLAQYRGHPGIQQRLGARNGSQPRVTLSFGLHYGWAIEGAVGTEFKIDASYLSPNVNIAETVERATETYGVVLLITESVLRICSEEIASKCRLLDNVIIQGCVSSLRLYVIDLSWFFISLESHRSDFVWSSRQRFRCRQWLEAEKVHRIGENVHMAEIFESSVEIQAMRVPYTLEFMQIFNMGYQNYHQGDWQVARRILRNTWTLLGFEDGPSATLLRFMETPFEFESPPGWRGIHHLESNGQLGPPVIEGGKTHVQIDRKSQAACEVESHLALGSSILKVNGTQRSKADDATDLASQARESQAEIPVEEPANLHKRITNTSSAVLRV